MRIIIILATIGVAMALPGDSTRIIGGEATSIEKYPFMAVMLFNLRTPICGGSLITRNSVLSAAHCYVNDPPTMWKVRLGSSFSNSGGNEHFVSKIIRHEEFAAGGVFVHDVAIIKLSNPTELSDKIDTARIAGPNYILPDNTPVHAVGWGITKWLGDVSEVLKHVEINTINHKTCTDRYALLQSLPWMTHIPDVTPEMLCTGVLNFGGKDSCQGDSGGPILHDGDVIIGIVSWGHRCASVIYPGVNTRVSLYADWIYNNAVDK